MNIKELLASNILSEQSKEKVLSALVSNEKNETPFKIGSSYLFRTVTHIQTGRVVSIKGKFIELEEAAWIADTGSFNECIKNGTFSEVEPVDNLFVNTDSLIDVFPWKHSLPREVK